MPLTFILKVSVFTLLISRPIHMARDFYESEQGQDTMSVNRPTDIVLQHKDNNNCLAILFKNVRIFFFHAFFLCLRLLFFSICANSSIISSNPLPVYTHLSSLYKTEQTQIRRYIVFRMKRREVKSERETIIEISEDPFLYWQIMLSSADGQQWSLLLKVSQVWLVCVSVQSRSSQLSLISF